MDAARRGRERAWAASAGDDDEARLLLERVRTGALAPERLELAAWLGQPAARLALGDAAPAGDHVPLGRWARALGDAALRALLVALLRAARDLPAGPEAVAEAAAAAEAWAGDPTPAGGAVVSAALDRLAEALRAIRAWTRQHQALAVLSSLSGDLGLGEDGHLLLGALALVPGAAGPAAGVLLGAEHARAGARDEGPAPEAGPRDAGPVRYLVDRASRGELAPARLEVAAWSGSATAARALEALGRSAPAPAAPSLATEWLDGLARWGPEAVAAGARSLVASAGFLEAGRRWRRGGVNDARVLGGLRELELLGDLVCEDLAAALEGGRPSRRDGRYTRERLDRLVVDLAPAPEAVAVVEALRALLDLLPAAGPVEATRALASAPAAPLDLPAAKAEVVAWALT